MRVCAGFCYSITLVTLSPSPTWNMTEYVTLHGFVLLTSFLSSYINSQISSTMICPTAFCLGVFASRPSTAVTDLGGFQSNTMVADSHGRPYSLPNPTHPPQPHHDSQHTQRTQRETGDRRPFSAGPEFFDNSTKGMLVNFFHHPLTHIILITQRYGSECPNNPSTHSAGAP